MDMIFLKPLESIKYIHIEYQTAQRAATHTIFSHFIPEMSPLKYTQNPTSRKRVLPVTEKKELSTSCNLTICASPSSPPDA
jgi:hypothetical protein